MSQISFRAVEKTYDGVIRVVKSLDLEIEKGEFLTMLGPSGSGKTTTLMMLAGFEQPTSGEIWLDGRAVTRLPPHKRNIGVVFQNYALFPHMTIAENIAFPLTVRKIGAAEVEASVKRALDMVKLSHLAGRKPGQLSGGQQQRIALARALVFEPSLVLMDEPLGALDKQLREHMQLEIKHLHERLGVTVVYVTHDQGEALTMSDRIAVFHDGEIQQLAPPVELYEHPSNAFVAGFIGENNALPGKVISINGDQARIELAGGVQVTAAAIRVTSPGQATTLSIRPERLKLGELVGDNHIQGQVIESIYHGDHLRLRINALGTDLTAKLPVGQAVPAPGSAIAVGFDWQDSRALDA